MSEATVVSDAIIGFFQQWNLISSEWRARLGSIKKSRLLSPRADVATPWWNAVEFVRGRRYEGRRVHDQVAVGGRNNGR